MRTLICGSIAYDNIMVFQDRFKNHILPDQIHILAFFAAIWFGCWFAANF